MVPGASRWSHRLVAARRWGAYAWAVLALLLAHSAANLEQVLEVGAMLPGSESEAVRETIDSLMPEGDAAYAVLVVTGIDVRTRPADRARIDSLVDALHLPAVLRVRRYREPRDSLLVGAGGTIVLAALDPDSGAGDRMIPPLRHATAPFVERWSSDGMGEQMARSVISNRRSAIASDCALPDCRMETCDWRFQTERHSTQIA